MLKYEKIANYINYIRNTYKLEITIKDYTGFISKNTALDATLRHFLAHTNPYCLFAKSTKTGYRKCLKQKTLLLAKCRKGKSFMGYCYAGIGELVIPIIKHDHVIASISIGPISMDPIKAKKLQIHTFSNQPEASQQKADELYARFMKPTNVDISSLVISLELLAEYLSEIADFPITDYTQLGHTNIEIQDYQIMDQIEAYLNENFSKRFTIADMADDLNLTTKVISRVIENTKSLKYKAYLNQIRIEKSKSLLLFTDLNISEIAGAVGLKDVVYFKELFKKELGLSPTEFIRYYKH